jgi:hypothetical protein
MPTDPKEWGVGGGDAKEGRTPVSDGGAEAAETGKSERDLDRAQKRNFSERWRALSDFCVGVLARARALCDISLRLRGCQIFLNAMYQKGDYITNGHNRYKIALT